MLWRRQRMLVRLVLFKSQMSAFCVFGLFEVDVGPIVVLLPEICHIKMLKERPFLAQWDLLWSMECERKNKSGDRHQMTKDFIAKIGTSVFLEEARHTFALLELGRYYDNTLQTETDLAELLEQMSEGHRECFDFAVYFAAWIKSEVHSSKRAFKAYDGPIKQRILERGSLQAMAEDITGEILGWTKFCEPFSEGINGVKSFLKSKGVTGPAGMHFLDDIEVRHILDQIVMYTGLD